MAERWQRLRQHPIALAVGAVIALAIAIGCLVWWLSERRIESTDDAYVDAHIVYVAPQIAGQVLRVLVNDNDLVQFGQDLVDIDSADVQARMHQVSAQLDQSRAARTQAQAQELIDRAQLTQARAGLVSAQVLARQAHNDLVRAQTLHAANSEAVSLQQLDQAQSEADNAAAQVTMAMARIDAAQGQLAASQAQITAAVAQTSAAQAEIEQNHISLGYTRIPAPAAGHVTRMNVAVGNQAQIGQDLLAIVPQALWVTANFKETQLDYIRAGQEVDIHIDAFPDRHLHGHVDSIQRGAGQAFALLPPENATGNFVKVVQRVPVKIVFDDLPADLAIGPGMSVVPDVHIR